MFNIGFAELLLVLIIAYVIVGPKDLPKVARWLGRMVRNARQLIKDLKAEVGWDEVMNETQDVRRDIEGALKDADIRKDLSDARKTLQQSIHEAEKETMKKPGGGEAAQASQGQAGPERPPREGTAVPVSFKEWESRKKQERSQALEKKGDAEHGDQREDSGETGDGENPARAERPEKTENPEYAGNPERTETPGSKEKTEEKEK